MLERTSKWAKTQCKAADSMMRVWSRHVPTWRKMLHAYKEGQSKLNPFEEPDNGVLTRMSTHDPELMNLIDGLLDELRKQLTREDSER